jgi:hypothetical protein
MYATCPAHLIFLFFIALIVHGEEHKLLSYLLGTSLHPPFTFSLFGANILSSSDSKAPSFHHSFALRVKDQYKRKCKITVLSMTKCI